MSYLPVSRKKSLSVVGAAGAVILPWPAFPESVCPHQMLALFFLRKESSHSGNSLGEHRPRKESASQQQMEVKIRVRKGQNDKVDKTPRVNTDGMDIWVTHASMDLPGLEHPAEKISQSQNLIIIVTSNSSYRTSSLVLAHLFLQSAFAPLVWIWTPTLIFSLRPFLRNSQDG